jgi:hypothetical protein
MTSPGYGANEKRVFAVLVVLVVLLVGVVTTFASQPGTGVTPTTSAEQSPTSYSTTSPLGLRLQVQLNTSALESGSGLTAEIAVVNTLDQNLSLTATYLANSTILTWNDYDFFCSNSGDSLRALFGYALFFGDYSAGNLSLAGDPLQLAPPVGIGCVTYVSPDSVVLLPGNDTAIIHTPNQQDVLEPLTLAAATESCQNPSPGTSDCGAAKGLSGYWNVTGTGMLQPQEAAIGSNYFVYFPPGEYTLAVQDEWGQSLYAHFEVTPHSVPAPGPSTTTVSTDSTLVEECPRAVYGSGFGTVTAGTASPALLCVQLYYYSDLVPLTINLTGALSIRALQYVFDSGVANSRTFDGAKNFTITASQSEVTVGGPANESEGVVVAYAVTADGGASGTYPLGLSFTNTLSEWAFGSQGPESCGTYGQLVAGSGKPNYDQGMGGCVTYDTQGFTTGSQGGVTVPGVSFPLIKGDLYFGATAVSSSTG